MKWKCAEPRQGSISGGKQRGDEHPKLPRLPARAPEETGTAGSPARPRDQNPAGNPDPLAPAGLGQSWARTRGLQEERPTVGVWKLTSAESMSMSVRGISPGSERHWDSASRDSSRSMPACSWNCWAGKVPPFPSTATFTFRPCPQVPHPHTVPGPFHPEHKREAEAELGLPPLQFVIFRKDTAAKHSSETITLLFA